MRASKSSALILFLQAVRMSPASEESRSEAAELIRTENREAATI